MLPYAELFLVCPDLYGRPMPNKISAPESDARPRHGAAVLFLILMQICNAALAGASVPLLSNCLHFNKRRSHTLLLGCTIFARNPPVTQAKVKHFRIEFALIPKRLRRNRRESKLRWLDNNRVWQSHKRQGDKVIYVACFRPGRAETFGRMGGDSECGGGTAQPFNNITHTCRG